MAVYLATGSADIELAEHWLDKLREQDVKITHDWTRDVRMSGANPREAPQERRYDWAQQDKYGVTSADTFWLLVPPKPSMGCWIELGIAIGQVNRLSTEIIVSGDWRSTIFTSLADRRFDSHEEAFQHVVSR